MFPRLCMNFGGWGTNKIAEKLPPDCLKHEMPAMTWVMFIPLSEEE